MLLDRLIGWVNPEAGLRRTRARTAMEAITSLGRQGAAGAYDGAAGGRRMANWRATGGGPNAEIAAANPRLRDRAQDLVRNDPLATRGVSVWVSNLIGAGIIPAFAGAKGKVKRLEQLAADHLDTLAIHASGRHDLYGIQRLAVRTMVESGEALIVRSNPPASRGLAVPLQLEVLEPDHLDSSRDGPTREGGRIVGGIEVNADGSRAAYWLFQGHPRDGGLLGSLRDLHQSVRVPADSVIHLYDMQRPGQMRGVTWLAPVILRLRELHDYADAHLVRQKIAACYAVFETVPDRDEATTEASKEPIPLEPGIKQLLPPGHDVKFGVPPQTEGYRDYTKAHERAIAMGLGIPAEALTGDLSEINFSSGRMGWLEFERSIDGHRWCTIIPHLCAGIGSWFLEAVHLSVADASGVQITWTPPARAMISPREDMTALEKGVALGVTSRSQAIRERGYDPAKVFAEIAAERQTLTALGIPISTDPKAPTALPEADAVPPTDDKPEEEGERP